jgi:hypothetical protein
MATPVAIRVLESESVWICDFSRTGSYLQVMAATRVGIRVFKFLISLDSWLFLIRIQHACNGRHASGHHGFQNMNLVGFGTYLDPDPTKRYCHHTRGHQGCQNPNLVRFVTFSRSGSNLQV